VIRVLTVDDSPTKRRFIRSILESDAELSVVGEATNGNEAVNLSRILKPDVVTMDLFMPEMDGFEAISQIMTTQPVPILALTSADLARLSFKALEAGALMILNTPVAASRHDPDAARLISTVKMLVGVKVVRRKIKPPALASEEQAIPPSPAQLLDASSLFRFREAQIVAIGASTGGPPALQSLFARLPANFPLPIVVVQHISIGFVAGLAQWLASSAALRVKIAENGEKLASGTIYIAAEQRHISILRQGIVALSLSTKTDTHCPSVNVLFESIAESYHGNAVGILLTGMGEDGARGLLRLRQAGAYTIAQDETSSVIFGMPKAAIERGAAVEALNLELISSRLTQLWANNR